MKEIHFSTELGSYRLAPGVYTGRPVCFLMHPESASDDSFMESVDMSTITRSCSSLEEAYCRLFAPCSGLEESFNRLSAGQV